MRLKLCLFLLTFVCALFLYTPQGHAEPHIVILCYHHIDLKQHTAYSVTSAQLASHVEVLQKAGYTFVALDAVSNFYHKNTALPEKTAVITFDDGSRTVFTRALPLLKNKGIPFTVFLYPTGIAVGHARTFMTWDEVIILAQNDVTIGSHSYYHPFLTSPPSDIRSAEDWRDLQIRHSKESIEQRTGKTIHYFALPFGISDSAAHEKIRETGYHINLNVNGTNNGRNSDPLDLNRIIVNSYDSPSALLKKAEKRALYIQTIHPAPRSTVTGNTLTLKMRIMNIEELEIKSIRISTGRAKDLQPAIAGNEITYTMALTRCGPYIVTISATDKHGHGRSGSLYFNAIVPDRKKSR